MKKSWKFLKLFFVKRLTLETKMSIVRVNTKKEVRYEQKRTIEKSGSK